MQLSVGQKVAYPNQGVCLVEEKSEQTIGHNSLNGYRLRVLGDNSTIFVPEENTDNVGIRPLISASQCRKLLQTLSEDFDPISSDWKTRAREFTEKLRSGDIFQTAEVFKMLTFLSHEKKLSFREQTLLEKAKFLIMSEINNTCPTRKVPGEDEITGLVETACSKHAYVQPTVMAASAAM